MFVIASHLHSSITFVGLESYPLSEQREQSQGAPLRLTSEWHHDTQHNDTHNNDSQYKGVICDIQHYDIQHYDTQHKGIICYIQYNDIQH